MGGWGEGGGGMKPSICTGQQLQVPLCTSAVWQKPLPTVQRVSMVEQAPPSFMHTTAPSAVASVRLRPVSFMTALLELEGPYGSNVGASAGRPLTVTPVTANLH